MGVPWAEAANVGSLLGIKTVLNEFVGYVRLQEMVAAGELSERSRIIATYALCGFANFSSIAIQIGGIGALAPERKADLARLGLRAMIAGVARDLPDRDDRRDAAVSEGAASLTILQGSLLSPTCSSSRAAGPRGGRRRPRGRRRPHGAVGFCSSPSFSPDGRRSPSSRPSPGRRRSGSCRPRAAGRGR